jgi:hypothetical protein
LECECSDIMVQQLAKDVKLQKRNTYSHLYIDIYRPIINALIVINSNFMFDK